MTPAQSETQADKQAETLADTSAKTQDAPSSIPALLGEGLRDCGAIIVQAGRLLLRHWPQLVALYLAGAAARMGFLWLALLASKASPLAGMLILPLAPISTLLALVFMIRVIGQSLPAFGNSFADQSLAQRIKSNVTLAARCLIPFIIVYAALGFLKEDIRLYIYGSTLDEAINDPLTANYGRALVATPVLIGIVLVALVARKLIAAGGFAERSLRWSLIGGYIETLWIASLGTAFVAQLGTIRDWAMSRVIFAQVTGGNGIAGDAASGGSEGNSGLPPFLGDTLAWAGSAIGHLADLLVVPVAWLAIAAMIYGSKLVTRNPLSHEAMTRRFAHIPDPLRRAVAQIFEPVTTPVKDSLNAVGKIAEAGLVSMIFFCILFSLADDLVKAGMAWTARALLGPQSGLWQLATAPYVALVERGLLFLIFSALTAAAVNQVLAAETVAKERT